MDLKRIAIYTALLIIGSAASGSLFGFIGRTMSAVRDVPYWPFFLVSNLTLLALQAAILFFFVKKTTENVALNTSAIAAVYLLILTRLYLYVDGFAHVGRMVHIYVVFVISLVLAVFLGNASRNNS